MPWEQGVEALVGCDQYTETKLQKVLYKGKSKVLAVS